MISSVPIASDWFCKKCYRPLDLDPSLCVAATQSIPISQALEEKVALLGTASRADLEALIHSTEAESYAEPSPRAKKADELPSGIQRSNAYAMPTSAGAPAGGKPVARSLLPSTSNKSLSRVSPASQSSLKNVLEGASPMISSSSSSNIARVSSSGEDSALSTIRRRSGESAATNNYPPPPAFQREQLMMLLDDITRRTGIDQPLCRDCAKVVLREQLSRIVELDTELNRYRALVDEMERSPLQKPDDDNNRNEAKRNDAATIAEEQILHKQLDELLQEVSDAQNQFDSLSDPLEVITTELVRAGLELEHRLIGDYAESTDQLHSLRSICAHNEALLCRFQQSHVLSRAFHIWFDGHFGTINGYRLGKLPSQPVEWPEINAAWGDTVLLLVTMAKRVGFRFQSFQPLPMGGVSRVENLTEKAQYELYGSSDLSWNRMFWSRRYDTAMAMFLACTKQLADFLIASAPAGENHSLPYKIDKDKIGEISIKLQFSSSEEQWTRALKFMLTNLKWMVLWLAAREPL